MKFRLKLDLSQFYGDERNLAYILIDSKWTQVHCLQQHVKKIFDVPDVQFQTDDGVYIPLRESIDVIKCDDVLKAIMAGKREQNSSRNNETMEEFDCSKKRHIKSDDYPMCSSCSTPNAHKRKKQRFTLEDDHLKLIPDDFNIMTDDCMNVPTEDSHMRDLEVSNINALQNGNYDSNIIDSNELEPLEQNPVIDDTIKAKKKKRLRKNKKSSCNLEKENSSNSRLSSVPVPISSSTLRLSNSMSTPNSLRQHVYLSEEEPTLAGVESRDGFLIYRCSLTLDKPPRTMQPEKDNDKDRIIQPEKDHDKDKEKETNPKKPIIEIQDNVVVVAARSMDLSLDKTNNDQNEIEMNEETHQNSSTHICVETLLPLSEELKDMPNEGDIILFKIFHLNEDCSPEISEYICGRCDKVDENKKTIICLIIDGLDQLRDNDFRLTPSDENQIKPCENTENCFEFFFNELLDKRVIKM